MLLTLLFLIIKIYMRKDILCTPLSLSLLLNTIGSLDLIHQCAVRTMKYRNLNVEQLGL